MRYFSTVCLYILIWEVNIKDRIWRDGWSLLTGSYVVVDVIAASVALGDPGDVLDVDDGVRDRLAGDRVSHDTLDAGMNLNFKNFQFNDWNFNIVSFLKVFRPCFLCWTYFSSPATWTPLGRSCCPAIPVPERKPAGTCRSPTRGWPRSRWKRGS